MCLSCVSEMASGRTSAQGHTPSHWSCPPAQTTSKGHEHDRLIHDSKKALKRGASTEHSHAMFLQIKIAKRPAETNDPYHWSLITGCFLTNSVSRRASVHPCSVLWLWSPLHCGNHLEWGCCSLDSTSHYPIRDEGSFGSSWARRTCYGASP